MIGHERWRFGTHPSRHTANACPVGGARGWPDGRAFCIGKAVWRASRPGQMMAMRVSRSSVNAYVHEMEPVCDGFFEQHLASPKPTPFLRLPN